MTEKEARRLGEAVAVAYQQWEDTQPAGSRMRLGGDRVRLLCAAMLVPHVHVRGQTVTMPEQPGSAQTWCSIDSRDHGSLLLAATVALVVHRMDSRGRESEVPMELRAAASVALACGLEVRSVVGTGAR